MAKNYNVGINPDWPATIYIDVLYNTDGIMVVSKPAGMDTFQTHYHRAGYPELVKVVQQHYPEYAHAHRIDRTTSGCHVFGTMGKNGKGTISILKKEWTEGVTKTYLAVVGSPKDKLPKWDELVLTMHVRHTNGLSAPCTTTMTNRGGGLIECELTKGGRNHQIRRALKAVGFPIMGDGKYKGPEGRRVMLHAWKWKFRDIEIQAKLPHDMEQWEPGGYTEPLSSFPVQPLSLRDMERLEEYRENNAKGTLGWPLPPEDSPGGVNTDEQEAEFREKFGYPFNHPLYVAMV